MTALLGSVDVVAILSMLLHGRVCDRCGRERQCARLWRKLGRQPERPGMGPAPRP